MLRKGCQSKEVHSNLEGTEDPDQPFCNDHLGPLDIDRKLTCAFGKLYFCVRENSGAWAY